jgi:predicted dinucleotide-utilizing enzyme
VTYDELIAALRRAADYRQGEISQDDRALLRAAADAITPTAHETLTALLALIADPKAAAARLQELTAATAEHAKVVAAAAGAADVLAAARAEQARELAAHQDKLDRARATHEAAMTKRERELEGRHLTLAESERQHALQHVPTGVNRDSQGLPEVRV